MPREVVLDTYDAMAARERRALTATDRYAAYYTAYLEPWWRNSAGNEEDREGAPEYSQAPQA